MTNPVKILLAQGHGAGSAHNRGGLYFNEGDNNFYYSLVLKEEMDKYKGVQVDLTRKNITDNPTLAQRSRMGVGYDLYWSIHSNAAEAFVRGSEVWDSVEGKTPELAKAMCDATANLFKHNNRGVRYKEGKKGWNWYGELRGNKAKSAMIVENGFHTNHEDCLFFKNNHRHLAIIQAKVVADYYKLKKKEVINMTKPSKSHKEDWDWGTKLGLTDGSNPRGNITREQMITVIRRTMGVLSETNNSDAHWANEFFESLNKEGIKISDKRFNEFVKRGEIFKLLDAIAKMGENNV